MYFHRNRYSVPVEYAHRLVSLRAYPDVVVMVAESGEIARHAQRFDRNQVVYDWQHYIPLLARKPGALRNGAPFARMPEAFRILQRQLLRQSGGDRVMAQVLAAVPEHGVETVQAGRVSADHVLNVLTGLLAPVPAPGTVAVATALALKEEPCADVERYDGLPTDTEVNLHVQ